MESASYAQQMEFKGFGKRLKQAREAADMPGRVLGIDLGYPEGDASRQTINDWENERHYPNVVQLFKICQKLKVTPDFLITGVDRAAQLAKAREAIEALSMDAPLGGATEQQPAPIRQAGGE